MATKFVLTYTERDGTIKEVSADAVTREGNTRVAEVTENPVERGADVADHIRPKTDTLVLEFYVTNTPIKSPTSHAEGVTGAVQRTEAGTVLAFSGVFDRVSEVHSDLKRVQDAGLKWTIFSGLTVYADFALAQIQAERDAKAGSSVKFVCTFQRLRIVATRQVSIPVRRRRVRPQQPRGVQQPEPPRNSVLSQVFRRLNLTS